ncbi:MAG: glycoside hydrolase family 13 protein [Calditrichia bacterium]
MSLKNLLLILLLLTGISGCSARGGQPDSAAAGEIPHWAEGAVWYQIFPGRFRNGDASNEPVRASLENPKDVPSDWQLSSWTADWYQRQNWEKNSGQDFYVNGVFNRRYGGDLQGIIDRLGYLDSLGVDAIYLNPVFYARSLHKYDGISFHHIDPYFGPKPTKDLKIIRSEQDPADPANWQWTAADSLFLDLLNAAHSRKIRIIIDGVWNHTGRDFFAFQDLLQNQQQSPYKSWYVVENFDNPATPENEFSYSGWHGYGSLPEFAETADSSNLAAGPRKYIMDATRRWMDPDGDGNPADGVDGWRLDSALDLPVAFWQEWHREVREINPQAYTVAEVLQEAHEFLEQSGFSASMNYHGFHNPVRRFLIDGEITASQFADTLAERMQPYSKPQLLAQQNLIDSHDMDRLGSMIVNRGKDTSWPYSPRSDSAYSIRKPGETDLKIQKLVVLFQMTFPGSPLIYYGSEAGMWGAGDPDNRQPMVWPD